MSQIVLLIGNKEYKRRVAKLNGLMGVWVGMEGDGGVVIYDQMRNGVGGSSLKKSSTPIYFTQN